MPPSPSSPVAKDARPNTAIAVERLASLNTDLAEFIATLTDKLVPVLLPEQTEDTGKAVKADAPEPEMRELSREIQSQGGRLNVQLDRLRQLIGRVDV